METAGEKNSDIRMNTKLIHYDQCYYNEHKINSSQRDTQSTTHLLYLLTKNNRRLSSTRVTHVAMGTASTSTIQKWFLPWESTNIFLQEGSLSTTVNKAEAVKTQITNGSPDLCCSLQGLSLGCSNWSTWVQYLRRCSHSGSCKCAPRCVTPTVSPPWLHSLQA